MRTSRISKETSKVLSATASPPGRRSTRSALSRFAHTGTTSTVKEEELSSSENEDNYASNISSDIEDALLPRKRRRNASNPRKSTSSNLKIKPETSSPRSVRKPARKVTDHVTGTVTIDPPADWDTVYALVKEMRLNGAARSAAVDTMGCERLALPTASERDQRYHTLTALMLSSQTKDTTNAAAMYRLQTELAPYRPGAEGGLNVENILAVEPEVLNELIWSVGFHNNKTRYIKATAEILRDQYASDIPDTIEGLTSLPGVGPKMAYLCLSSAWGKDEGIGVDVHVHRITNLWGWHGAKESKGPEETRTKLQSWLPRDKWREINWLLVGFGQTICAPERGRRRCGECEVGLAGLCKSAERGKVNLGKRIRAEKLEVEIKNGEVKVHKQDVIVKKEIWVDDAIVNGTDVELEVKDQEVEGMRGSILKREPVGQDDSVALEEPVEMNGRKRRKR